MFFYKKGLEAQHDKLHQIILLTSKKELLLLHLTQLERRAGHVWAFM